MPRRQKFKDVMSVIERRIRQGDYVLSPIPGERKIAEETGVSHMTARKAVRSADRPKGIDSPTQRIA